MKKLFSVEDWISPFKSLIVIFNFPLQNSRYSHTISKMFKMLHQWDYLMLLRMNSKKGMCCNEIALCDWIINIILSSFVHTIGRAYMIIERERSHQLLGQSEDSRSMTTYKFCISMPILKTWSGSLCNLQFLFGEDIFQTDPKVKIMVLEVSMIIWQK